VFLTRIPSSRHLRPGLNRKILDVALLRLRFCSISQVKSAANPGCGPRGSYFFEQALCSKKLLKNSGCSKIVRSSHPQNALRRRSSATPHERAFEDGGEMAVFQQPARGVMGKGIFITGTDTGVGKTIVTAVLARLLRMRGVRVGVMKPVTSGCSEVDGALVSDDALLTCRAAGIPCSGDVVPYLLREPLTPAEAAKIDGVGIEFARIRESFDRLSQEYDFVLVEGAGGLMVPVVGGFLMADLAKELDLPLLVVARPNLGTINHTVLTCFAAQQMGIPVSGVIINNFPKEPDLAEQSAPHYIGSLCGAPVLGVWPHEDAPDQMAAVERLAVWLDRQPESAVVLRELGV